MRISDLILSKQEIKEDNARSKEINVYRIILLLCSTFTLLLWYLFINAFPDSYDPLWVRIAFSSLLILVFILTYFKNFADRIFYLNYLVFIIYSYHGMALIYENDFAIHYILEFIILVIMISLAFRSKKQIYIYLSLIFISYALVCLVFSDHFIEVFVNISLLGIFCAAILIFFDLRVETEKELRIREDLLNTVFNESPDAMFLVNPASSLITNCNDRAIGMFEFGDRKKVIGNNLNFLLKYPYSPGAWKNLKKKVGKKRFLIQELEFKATSNYTFWGSQAITEINVGKIIYWLVRITDITERVKDKKTIEENRKMLRQVVDLVPHQIFLKDNEGRFILVNKAVADNYETTSDNMIGKKDSDFSNSEEAKRFMEVDREVMDDMKIKIIPEEHLTDKTGFTRILQTTKMPFYLDDESKPGLLGIAIDITERVRDKQTIEENSKMLTQVIDLVPHQIYLKDSKGRYLLVNQGTADFHQLLKDEMIGKSDYDLLPEAEVNNLRKIEEDVIQKGRSRFIPEEIVTDKEGNKMIMNTIKMPFYLSDRQEMGILGINIDITERVTDKKTIEENREMLMKLINVLPHQIYLKDSKGKLLLVNQRLAEFHQMTVDEILGKSDFDLFPEEQARHFYNIEQQIINTGAAQNILEEYYYSKKGKIVINQTTKMPFNISGKNETGILGVNIDITEEKFAEKALRESEAKYKMLMAQASDGIYLSDQEGNILDANQKACEMFGYTLKEFLTINIKKLVDPKGLPDAPVRIPDNNDRQSIIVERRFLKKDGTPFTVELSAKLLEDGSHQAIIRDITERKRVERVLKDNEKKFRALIENSSDIILIVGEDFKLKFVSPSVTRILGFDPERLINKSLFEFIHADDIDSFSKFLSEILGEADRTHIIDEMRIRMNSGQYIYTEIVGTNMLLDPVVSGIIINCHDITKRKQTEKELLNTNFELDSFVYKASHDLKAPLRSVMGLIKLAKLESSDDKQHVYLDMMNKSVLSLDSFIKDLTQFSRNSRMEIEAREIKFDDIINESFGNLKFMDNVEKVTLNKILKIHTKFYSDLTRLSTIFNNLISNAFKYHRFENNNPYINIIIETNPERAMIIVEDNGQGIDQIHLDRVFEMFYRASETSYGSGLGLYIVKNAVNKLNGTIRVESAVNQGTSFIIVIPNLINKAEKNEG
ncbi:MAG: PAS domain S-box protein [Cytophagaceae bacterium]|nr:PAS domain S-box protein [Cytophagaceae bacterium]